MPTTPIAYNTGSPIAGTTQTGSLAVGSTAQPYCNDIGGVKWWMGPEESLGYVIGKPVPAGNQPTPIPGVSASVGFYRSAVKTAGSFLTLTNRVFSQIITSSFTNASSASNWLTSNGYWNTYDGSGSVSQNFTIYTEWIVSSSLDGFLIVPTIQDPYYTSDTQFLALASTPLRSITLHLNPTSNVLPGAGVSPQVSSSVTSSVTNWDEVAVGFKIMVSGSSRTVGLRMYRNGTVVDSYSSVIGPFINPTTVYQYNALYISGAVGEGDVFKFEFFSGSV
jgi:hypothetical protein